MLLNAPFQGEESRKISRQCMKMAGQKSHMYAFLWHDLAQTYWYDGNFKAYVKELEALRAWEKLHPGRFGSMVERELGRGYEILGDLKRAEQAYIAEKDGEGLVRLYTHQERWWDARAALEAYPKSFERDEKTILAAGIDELEGKLEKVSPEQMAAAQRLGQGGNYYAFFLGLFQLRDGQREKGRETLQLFYDTCQSNPEEWGVTLAWECRRAKQILQKQ